MVSRKMWAFFVLVLVLTLLCSPGVLAKQRKLVAINFSSIVGGTEKAFAEFTEETGIEVEAVVVSSWTVWDEKVRLMLAAGQQLDLLRCDTGRAAMAALEGWLIPLGPLVARDNVDISVIPKPVLWHAPYPMLGDFYTIPYNVAMNMQFYNRAHFAEAGLNVPPVQWGHPDLQFDKWVNLVKKLQRTGTDGKVERWGTLVNVGTEGYLLLGIFGVDWVTPMVDRFLGAAPEVVNAYTNIINLWLVDRVAPRVNERSGVNLLQGNLSTNLRDTGAWIFNIKPNEYDIGVAPLPWGTVDAARGGINSWGISSTCTDVEAAWEFIKYFTLGKGLLPWMEYVTQSPFVHREYLRLWLERARTAMPNADFSVMLDAGNHYWDTGLTLAPAASSITPIFNSALRKASTGDAPVSVAMGEVEAAINQLLRENPLFK